MALAVPDASPVGAGTVKALGTKIMVTAMARNPPLIAPDTIHPSRAALTLSVEAEQRVNGRAKLVVQLSCCRSAFMKKVRQLRKPPP